MAGYWLRLCLALAGASGILLAMAAIARDDGARADEQPAWLTAELQRGLDEIRIRYAIPGVALSIALPGESTSRSFVSGGAVLRPSTGDADALSPRHLFQIGSITKTLTAALLLLLEEQRLLRLDAPLSIYLPEYPDWKGATVRQLLNMTSGVADYSSAPSFLPAVQSQPGRPWSVTDLVGLAYESSPNTSFAPGEGWEYSNTNYILAELVVERVTGAPFAVALQERLLGWSGARLLDTHYIPDSYPPAVAERMAHGYNRNGVYPPDTDVTDFNLSWARGAGGLVSNTVDVVAWVRALFGGAVLKPAQMTELTRLVSAKTGAPTDQRDPDAYGLGMDHSVAEALGPFWFKSGETFGYNSFVMHLPCFAFTFAAIKTDATETDEGMTAIQNMVVDSVLRSAEFQNALARRRSTHPAPGGCPPAPSPTNTGG